MSARTCPNCGHPVAAAARFCINCGADIGRTDPGARGEVRWRAVEGIGIYLLAFVVTVLFTLPLPAVTTGDALVVLFVLVNEAALLAVVLAWVRVRHGARPSALGLRGFTPGNIGVGVAVGAAGIVSSIVVAAVMTSLIEAFTDAPVKAPKQIPFKHDPAGAVLALTAVSVLVIAPIAEELFFRGFLYRALRRWARVWPAILISAGIFAASHIIPLVIPPVFALGILLALAVERSGSVVPSIVAHMTFNVFGFVFQFVVK